MSNEEDKSKYKIVYENDPELTPIDKVPTQKNPDVKVEVGKAQNGSVGVRSLEYPAEYGLSKVRKKVQKFKAEKEDNCPICKDFEGEEAQPESILPFASEGESLRPKLMDNARSFSPLQGAENRSVPLFNRPAPFLDRVKGRLNERNQDGGDS